jgi:RNA polymerase sigma-70 factor (ECF subfamily)
MEPSPPSLLRALQENASFVRALARSLVGDDQTADDLAQDTWIIALKHPTGHLENVRAWLGTVAERSAGRRRLADSRRVAREVAAAELEASTGGIEAVEWEDTLRRVGSAVLSLEEPDRATILLRYYEGLSAAAIAVRMGVPASTVRGRLQRALSRLRVILDQKSGGDREAWIRGLIPLIGGKFGSVGSSAGVAACGGVVVMGATAKVTVGIVAAVCVGALGWWGMEAIGPPERSDLTTGTVMPVVRDESDPAAQGATATELAADRIEVVTTPDDQAPSNAVSIQDQIRACLEDESTRFDCLLDLARRGGGLPPEQIASFVCSQGPTWDSKQVLLCAMIESCDSFTICDALNTVYSHCPHFTMDDLIARAVEDVKSQDPLAYASLHSQLTPENLFRADGGLMAIRLAASIAESESDQFLRGLLEAGARGELGGTCEQIDYAILAASGLQTGAEECIRFTRSLLAAAVLPETVRSSGIGSTMALLVLSKRLNGAIEEHERITMIGNVLADPRFSLGAAVQIAKCCDPEHPPCDMSAVAWSGVWKAARAIGDEAGVQW